jgi:hypothetical protein
MLKRRHSTIFDIFQKWHDAHYARGFLKKWENPQRIQDKKIEGQKHKTDVATQ